jgi:diguanylate cyclase (GGDEF)-like protein/PAS domain S-box-containing protein
VKRSNVDSKKEELLYYAKTLGLGLMLAMIYWVGESLLHVFIFHTGSMLQSLIPNNRNEIWMRGLGVFLFFVVTFIVAYTLRRKMRLSKLHKLVYFALNEIREAVVITDQNNKIIYINKGYTNITGYSFDEICGKNPRVLSSGRQDKEFYKKLWAGLNEKGFWEGEMWNRRKSGGFFAEWINISLLTDPQIKNTYHVAVFSDITARKENEEQIKYYAFYDSLTHLPNRRFFMEKLNQLIVSTTRCPQIMAVLFIDVDHFKSVNDRYGHLVGDTFLCEIALFLQSAVRKSDVVSRFGGDEFVILLTHLVSREAALKIASKILKRSTGVTLTIEGHSIPIMLSIGSAIYPEDSLLAEELIQRADEAMYKVKKVSRQNDVI